MGEILQLYVGIYLKRFVNPEPDWNARGEGAASTPLPPCQAAGDGMGKTAVPAEIQARVCVHAVQSRLQEKHCRKETMQVCADPKSYGSNQAHASQT